MIDILIVEDEPPIANLIKLSLAQTGYRCTCVLDGMEAADLLEHTRFDLILLDVMLPKMDGFEICRSIRASGSKMGIIMLTALGQEMDKVTGLMTGADDYVTKPFNPLELAARVKTQLRRYIRYNTAETAPKEITEYDFRGLQISKNSHKCMLFGQELALTPREFSILWYLCQRRGSVVSSEELFEQVWGETFLDSNNTVMSHIARLREKMHDSGKKPKVIKTVWGVGYTIE